MAAGCGGEGEALGEEEGTLKEGASEEGPEDDESEEKAETAEEAETEEGEDAHAEQEGAHEARRRRAVPGQPEQIVTVADGRGHARRLVVVRVRRPREARLDGHGAPDRLCTMHGRVSSHLSALSARP